MRNTARQMYGVEHEILGRMLREFREAARLSQREVSKRVGRAESYLWKIETGNQGVDLFTLFQLLDIFGVDSGEFTIEFQRRVKEAREGGLDRSS